MKFYIQAFIIQFILQNTLCQSEICDLTKCQQHPRNARNPTKFTLGGNNWKCEVTTSSSTTCANEAEIKALATEIRVESKYPESDGSNTNVKLPSNLNEFSISNLILSDVVPTFDDHGQNWPGTLTKMSISDEYSKSHLRHLPNLQNSSIEKLEFKRIDKPDEFRELTLVNFNKLTRLRLYKCEGLQDLSKLLTGLETLKELKVESNSNLNYAGKLPPNWTNLTNFHLTGNKKLATLLPDFFASAPNLATIVCSDTKVKPNCFSQEQVGNIDHLTLANVNMTSEEFSTILEWLGTSNNVKSIDISDNDIRLTGAHFDDLLKLENLKTLKLLQGNTYDKKDCHVTNAIKDLIEQKGMDRGVYNGSERVEHCKKIWRDKVTLAIITSIAVVLAFIIVISAVIYKFRYWFYSKEIFSRFFSNDDDEQESFDAFLTFNEADRQIMKEIKDGLTSGDHQRKFKIATHDDEFVAGERIEENMRLCISQSRRTVAIISRDFLRSEYCQQELILMTSAENVHKIIVILLDPMIRNDSTNALLDRYFKTHTYLDYDNGSDRFWKRLIYALPHRRMTRVPHSHVNTPDQQTELQRLA